MRYFNIYSLLLSAIGLLAINLTLAIYMQNKTMEGVYWVAHTNNVINQTDQLNGLLKEAYISIRGYALTGDKASLDSYNRVTPQILPAVEILSDLVKNHLPQFSLVKNELEPLIIKGIKHREYLKDRLEKEGPEVVPVLLKEGTANRIRESVAKLLRDISIREKVRLAERQHKMIDLLNITYHLRIGSLVFFMVVMGMGIAILRNKDRSIQALFQELDGRNATLAASNEKLKKLNEEKNRFLSMAAHDLKNPILAITSLAEVMGRLVDNEKTEKDRILEYIHESSRKMSALIHNLLNYQMIENGELKRKIELVDLYEVTMGNVDVLRQLAADKNIKIEVISNAKGKNILADKRMYVQILDNLASNAIKFSPHGKKVMIRLEVQHSAARLTVEDEGPGIQPEEEKLLFKEFKKLSAKPTGNETSTGLGLSAAKKYADLMNATLYYERPENGIGARFILLITNLIAPA